MDFLTTKSSLGTYDEQLSALGSRIFRSSIAKRGLPSFAKEFWRILKQHGPFDVVHSHLHHFSGAVLAVARLAGVPIRVAHSHSDRSSVDSSARLFRRLYLWFSRKLIQWSCTKCLAVSEGAAASLLGNGWQNDPRVEIFRCGLDFEQFRSRTPRPEALKSLGVQGNPTVFGTIGRLVASKNHSFLLDIFSKILDRDPNSVLVIVGDGPMRQTLEDLAGKARIANRVYFTGARSDIPAILTGAFDVFIFPSLYEGLPLALLEAQAAGVPSIVSTTITPESFVIPELIKPLPLSDGPESWAQSALEASTGLRELSFDSVDLMLSSKFAIQNSVNELCRIYRTTSDSR